AFAAMGPGDLAGGSKREAELRHVGAAATTRLADIGAGLALLRQFAERQGDGIFLAGAEDPELDGGARRHRADRARQRARILHRLAVHRQNDISGLDAGLGRRAARLRFGNERAFRFLDAEAVGDVGGHRLNLNADPAARDGTPVLELRHDALDRLSRDRESDAHRAAGRRKDRRVDADDVTIDVEGWATGIALVHRRIDLNEIVVGAGADIAPARRDDAG